MTTDLFFINLIFEFNNLKDSLVSKRDKKILLSLYRLIQGTTFITKNQGDLLLKILKENSEILKIKKNDIDNFLLAPTWSKKFRLVESSKKIYLKKDNFDEFFIEFSFNSKIKKTLFEILNKGDYNVRQISSTVYSLTLTEKNLYQLIKGLEPYKFQIEEKLLNFYKEIDNIIKNKDLYIDELNGRKKFFSHLENEIGVENIEFESFLLDRRFRYAYSRPLNKTPENLLDLIVNRPKTKIWIDRNKIELEEILKILNHLKRFPILCALDQNHNRACFEQLINLYKILVDLEKNCGVYFRLDSDQGTEFNQFINQNKLNRLLDKSSDCVIISNNKLPKFFINSNWYPRTVISFANNFVNNKPSVWCNEVDLIIYYTEKQPIISDTHAVV